MIVDDNNENSEYKAVPTSTSRTSSRSRSSLPYDGNIGSRLDQSQANASTQSEALIPVSQRMDQSLANALASSRATKRTRSADGSHPSRLAEKDMQIELLKAELSGVHSDARAELQAQKFEFKSVAKDYEQAARDVARTEVNQAESKVAR